MNVLWQQILKADPEYKPAPAYDKDQAKYDRMIVLPGGGWVTGEAAYYHYGRVDSPEPVTDASVGA